MSLGSCQVGCGVWGVGGGGVSVNYPTLIEVSDDIQRQNGRCVCAGLGGGWGAPGAGWRSTKLTGPRGDQWTERVSFKLKFTETTPSSNYPIMNCRFPGFFPLLRVLRTPCRALRERCQANQHPLAEEMFNVFVARKKLVKK